MQGEEVRLLPPGHLDGERDAAREPNGHGGAERAVVRHLPLHAVLAHCAEGAASGEVDYLLLVYYTL